MFRGAFTALVTPLRHDRLDEPASSRLAEHAAGRRHPRPGPLRHHRRGQHPVDRRAPARRRARDPAVAGRVPVLAGAASQRHPRGSRARPRLQAARRRRHPAGHALLQQADPGRPHRPLHRDRRGQRAPGRRLQRARPHRRRPPPRDRRHPRPPPAHRRHQRGDRRHDPRRPHPRAPGGDDRFDLLSGDDFTLLPFLALGGHGVISVTSNVAPALARPPLRRRQQPLGRGPQLALQASSRCARALFGQPNPIPVKSALALLGRCSPEMRLPLVAIDPQSREGQALADALQSLGLTP
jgi:hypothetical protein